MTSDNAVQKLQITGEGVTNLMSLFEAGMLAYQTQDINTFNQYYTRARNIFAHISPLATPEQLVPARIVLSFIEVINRMLQATVYLYDEKYKKAIEEFDAAGKICAAGKEMCHQTSEETFEELGIVSFTDIFNILFDCFRLLVTACIVSSQISLDKENRKFVDDIKLLRASAADLMQVQNLNYGTTDATISNLLVMVNGILYRFAQITANRADRLEEKRKDIEFLAPIANRVFIVHGHNEGILLELKQLLITSFRVDPIVLKEEDDNGQTVIEKFEAFGRVTALAFVIVTPDDWVKNKGITSFQARPNVLFELGWFCGRYGREKVRVLRQKNTPLPSDLGGLITIDFSDHVEEAYRKIQYELEKAAIIQPANTPALSASST